MSLGFLSSGDGWSYGGYWSPVLRARRPRMKPQVGLRRQRQEPPDFKSILMWKIRARRILLVSHRGGTVVVWQPRHAMLCRRASNPRPLVRARLASRMATTGVNSGADRRPPPPRVRRRHWRIVAARCLRGRSVFRGGVRERRPRDQRPLVDADVFTAPRTPSRRKPEVGSRRPGTADVLTPRPNGPTRAQAGPSDRGRFPSRGGRRRLEPLQQ